MFGLFNSFLIVGVLGIAGVAVSHFTSVNPLTKIREDGVPHLATLDSFGTIFMYPIAIQVKPALVRANVGGVSFVSTHDRDNYHELQFSNKAIQATETDEELILRVPKKDMYGAAFKFDKTPLLLYNRKTNSLLTKGKLQDIEDSSGVEALLTYANLSSDRLVETMENYSQGAIRVLLKKFDGQRNSIMLLVLLVIGAIAFFLFGGDKFVMNLVGNTAGAVSTIPQPIPTEATVLR